MQLSNSPVKLVLPFASSGNKNSIPVNSQIGITPGAASLADGFPPLTMTPVAAGGVPPSGLDMNGILYELSAIVRWANAGGGYAYDADFATDVNVGGYPKGARVLRADGFGYWFNTTDNNATDPETAGAAAAGWVPDFSEGVASVTMTSANITLSPAQYGKSTIVLSGAITSDLNLIFPQIAATWAVLNTTTGGFKITAKTAAGVGSPIAAGFVGQVICDGTEIYAQNLKKNAIVLTDFGAVGDGGVTNNLSAVNAAIAAAGNRPIIVPVDDSGGDYAITSGTLTIPATARFIYESVARIYASGGAIVDSGRHFYLFGGGSGEGLATTRTLGIGIELNGGNSGTASSSTLQFNRIRIVGDTLDAEPDANGTKVDGLLVHHSFGGTGAKGGRHAVEAILSQDAATEATNPDRNYVASVGLCETSTGDGGTLGAEKGAYFGGNFYGRAISGAMHTINVTGCEFNVAVWAGASTKYRSGVQIIGGGDQQGTTTDAGISISNLGSSSAKWKNGLLFGNQNGQTCFNSSSRVINVGAETVDRVINLESLVSSNYLLYGPAGKVTLTDTALVLSDAGANIRIGAYGVANAPFHRFRSGGTAAPNYDSQIIASGGTGNDGEGVLGITASTMTVSGILRSSSDNLFTLGAASFRWSTVYAGTGTINTSDEREKQQIRELSDVERQVALRLKSELVAFKFNDAVERKDTAARIHFGVIAQRVKAAFESEGLVAENYAVLCYDEWADIWEDVPEITEKSDLLDERGLPIMKVIQPASRKLVTPAGNRYGVRYDELFAFIIGSL